MAPVVDQRRLHPRLTETDLDTTPFVPELSPVIDPQDRSRLMTRPWLDWARRLTLLVASKTSGGSGGGESDPTHVVGPVTATPDAVAVYDGGTGKLIKDSLKTIAQIISDAVSQAIATILPGGKLPVSNLSAHHTTHEVGGSDALVNAAWTDRPNTFTENQTLARLGPVLMFNDTGQAAGNQIWKMWGSNYFYFVPFDDDQTTAQSYPLRLFRDGSAAVDNKLTVNQNLTVNGNSGNVACKDQANVFTYDQTISGNLAALQLIDSTQPTGYRYMRLVYAGQNVAVQRRDDAGTTLLQNLLTVTALGDVFVSGVLYEQGRAVPVGHWIDIPYNAGDFTSNTGSWTVPGFQTFAYMLCGKTMFLSFYAANTSISGTPSQLLVALPVGFTSVHNIAQSFGLMTGGVPGTGWGVAMGGGIPQLALYRDILGTPWTDGPAHIAGTFIIDFN